MLNSYQSLVSPNPKSQARLASPAQSSISTKFSSIFNSHQDNSFISKHIFSHGTELPDSSRTGILSKREEKVFRKRSCDPFYYYITFASPQNLSNRQKFHPFSETLSLALSFSNTFDFVGKRFLLKLCGHTHQRTKRSLSQMTIRPLLLLHFMLNRIYSTSSDTFERNTHCREDHAFVWIQHWALLTDLACLQHYNDGFSPQWRHVTTVNWSHRLILESITGDEGNQWSPLRLWKEATVSQITSTATRSFFIPSQKCYELRYASPEFDDAVASRQNKTAPARYFKMELGKVFLVRTPLRV